MNRQLFEGELIRLVAPEPDRDAATLSRWTHDAEFMQLMGSAPVRPLAPSQVKKEQEPGEGETPFRFLIQARATERMVGFIRLVSVGWSHGFSALEVGIGEPAERNRGYGSEALRLLLRFAFHELNLHRVGAVVPGHNDGALRFFQRAGFAVEARRRQALHRFGRRWDAVHLGVLSSEWRGAEPGGQS
jgi:RimJ/RimL family protein N-acetyltransferase